MRTLFLALFALLTTPALAQDWGSYANPRFGFSIDIPEGFVGQGEPANGDGQHFAVPGKAIALSVWGGHSGIVTPDFESDVAWRMEQDIEAGWNITYQATTPRWASWSGLSGGQVVYQRMILLCDGASYAAFRAEYGQRDRIEMDAIVERLVQSLKGDC
ncbi:hypothetical protein [Devosia sp. SL43]|uniref:hypothetical protein n=1 Tax=Devosia sp. SL43 TaxID=2806348 RepID=UPI001F20A142|nr:hypothetical protein [Devosia sp. SL43]UJW85208.1 hypothetical protein IM737_17675 [Devosia sp. SL43]